MQLGVNGDLQPEKTKLKLKYKQQQTKKKNNNQKLNPSSSTLQTDNPVNTWSAKEE